MESKDGAPPPYATAQYPPGAYPPGAYPPPPPQGQGYYPPPQGGMPPPPQAGYGPPPPQAGYAPPPQPGYYPPPQMGYGPPQPQMQQSTSSTNVVVVGNTQPAVQTVVVQKSGVNHVLHFIITLFFWPWIIVWIILCIID